MTRKKARVDVLPELAYQCSRCGFTSVSFQEDTWQHDCLGD